MVFLFCCGRFYASDPGKNIKTRVDYNGLKIVTLLPLEFGDPFGKNAWVSLSVSTSSISTAKVRHGYPWLFAVSSNCSDGSAALLSLSSSGESLVFPGSTRLALFLIHHGKITKSCCLNLLLLGDTSWCCQEAWGCWEPHHAKLTINPNRSKRWFYYLFIFIAIPGTCLILFWRFNPPKEGPL